MLKGTFNRTLIAALLVLLALGTIAGVQYFRNRAATDKLVLSGTIEADEIHVGSKVGGRIAQVLVREGQQVKEGDVLIKFDEYDLGARLSDARAAVAMAEANYKKALSWYRPEEVAQAKAQAEAAWMNYEEARNGPRKQEIDAARAEVDAAEADYDVSRATLARVERLTESGVQSKQDYDNARAAFERADARRNNAREKLKLLLAGTRPEEIERTDRLFKQAEANRQMVEKGARKEDIDAAKAQLDRAKSTVAQIETQMTELEVKSPADAFVEVLQVRPGELIQPNSPVATLVELNRLWVRVYVPEPEMAYVQLEKEVSIEVDKPKGKVFRGKIEQISSRGEFTPRNVQTRDERTHQVFGVRVRVDNSERMLRAGMAADVVIPRNSRE